MGARDMKFGKVIYIDRSDVFVPAAEGEQPRKGFRGLCLFLLQFFIVSLLLNCVAVACMCVCRVDGDPERAIVVVLHDDSGHCCARRGW